VVRCPTLPVEQANIPYIPTKPNVVWAYLVNQSVPTYIPTMTFNGPPGGAVYKLEFLTPLQAGTRDDAFETYWVPYAQDTPGLLTMLGNDAEFMFTAKMTGCSFGIGSHAGNGVVGVAHSNAMASGSAVQGDDQRKRDTARRVQQGMLRAHRHDPGGIDLSVRIISYDMYMMNGAALDAQQGSTTYGVHDLNQSWFFSTLKYSEAGRTITHRGVTLQVSGAF
jgi:hypothetical protein